MAWRFLLNEMSNSVDLPGCLSPSFRDFAMVRLSAAGLLEWACKLKVDSYLNIETLAGFAVF